MIVTALLQQRPQPGNDGELERRYVDVDAETYEAARAEIDEQLPAGWIVGFYRVDRDPTAG